MLGGGGGGRIKGRPLLVSVVESALPFCKILFDVSCLNNVLVTTITVTVFKHSVRLLRT